MTSKTLIKILAATPLISCNSLPKKDGQVWHDNLTGKQWRKLPEKFDYKGALAKCASTEVNGLKFALPSKKEFETAIQHGIIVQIGEDWYWTSTVYPDNDLFAWETDSASSGEYVSRDYKRSVVCVSR